MRRRIFKVVPRAEEVWSYGMPAFRVDGNIVAGIRVNKASIGYYPFSGSVLRLFSKELKSLDKTMASLQIPLDKPLSQSLIKKLIEVRISQCPVKRGEVDLRKYQGRDDYWKSIGIAAPARRGLVDARLRKLSDLRKITEGEFLEIHGIGPGARKIIKSQMRRSRISFKSPKR
jgi:uncharacterized protein YdhG (YjbR/CyaY superfamily)